MGLGAFLEPLVVATLLIGGTWINRLDTSHFHTRHAGRRSSKSSDEFSDKALERLEEGMSSAYSASNSLLPVPTSRSLSPSLLLDQECSWRTRQVGLWVWKKEIITPNTAKFRNRPISRILRRFPFLVECWYWALVYWTYQLARAFTAVALKDKTVEIARKHAIQLINLEEGLHIFCEMQIQRYFLRHSMLIAWMNWLYSFIHIPGTIAFLVCLYYYTTTRNRMADRSGSPTDAAFYQARRRTLALCNLLAFVIFTLWPCMPPRLLRDSSAKGSVGELPNSYGFVDTVHGAFGASSVWTQNKFCNQYAAMPSLHFGYSFMIGITIMTIPLQNNHSGDLWLQFNISRTSFLLNMRCPSWQRAACVALGFMYPLLIFVAIISTANHFILDAFAGAIVCALAWWGNNVLLNLLPLEDYFFWMLKIHKPEQGPAHVHARSPFIYGDFEEDP
ncbi:hypothetical protein AJ79_05649 [Helicocarpus griseus UAMH5409]|uniref:Inositolphosphotransferase Aur1/Ipt1 domain-containing protein n=1 Tax=Helicocarpus griseus UAMH5409 TaxID=1447875 RepID=A0A2B7XLC2_9EURO|nr:hypothetical protein AJ79_05649 [Helicocarpus griseus UAMH5409]